MNKLIISVLFFDVFVCVFIASAQESEEYSIAYEPCCNHGVKFAATNTEDCSTATPPDDIDPEDMASCKKFISSCCNEHIRMKEQCTAGTKFAMTKQCYEPKEELAKTCCDECSLGIWTGETQGKGACGDLPAYDGLTPSLVLRRTAYRTCCIEAVERAAATTTPKIVTTTEKKKITPKPDVCKNNGCEQLCVNEDGKPVCKCKKGYKLDDNGKNCKDINECAGLDDLCTEDSTVCHNTPGSYKCVPLVKRDVGLSCPPGFKRNILNHVCDDINECQLPRPPCPKYLCENTIGGFKCAGKPGTPASEPSEMPTPPRDTEEPPKDDRCPPGFRSGPDDECVDIDECNERLDDCQRLSQNCFNSHGSYFCQDHGSKRCAPGFKFISATGVCEDINECEEDNEICRQGEVCVNLPGAYNCKSKISTFPKLAPKSCGEGTRQKPGSTICEDIDECRENLHLCDGFQNCINTYGGHECRCKNGFELEHNSGSCVDIDECAMKLDNCPAGQNCINTLGSFLCTKQKSTSSTSTTLPPYEYEYYDSEEEIETSSTPETPSKPTHHTPSRPNNRPEPPRRLEPTSRPEPTYPTTPSRPNNRPEPPRRLEPTNRPEPTYPTPSRPNNRLEPPRHLEPTRRPEPPSHPKPPSRPEPSSRPDPPSRSEIPNYPEETSDLPRRPNNGYPEYPRRPVDPRRPETPRRAEYPNRPETSNRPEPPSRPETPIPPEPSSSSKPPNRSEESNRPERPRRPDYGYPEYPRPDEPPRRPESPNRSDFSNRPDYPRRSEDSSERVPEDSSHSEPPRQPPSSPEEPGSLDRDYPEYPRRPNYPRRPDVPRRPEPPSRSDPPRHPEETNRLDPPSRPDHYPEYPTPEEPRRPEARPSTESTKPNETTDDDQVGKDRNPYDINKMHCFDGYIPDENRQCIDIDECKENKQLCSNEEVCVNRDGGYVCECGPGLKRNDEGWCKPIPTTTSTTTPRPTTTPRAVTSATTRYNNYPEWTDRPHTSRPDSSIQCELGYTYDRNLKRCIDIDECEIGKADCASGERCVNTRGGYKCVCYRDCGRSNTPNHGHRHSTHEPRITVGSVYGNKGPLYMRQTLTRLDPGTIQASCPWGYSHTDDRRCIDIDECSTSKNECGPQQKCENFYGGYSCKCPKGYKKVGKNDCEDIDECTASLPCSSYSECVNTAGSYNCRCTKGYKNPVNDNKVCVDINECEEQGVCEQECNNVWGSYRCSCKQGYKLRGDNSTCEDIDECKEWAATGRPGRLCFGHCINVEGSYRCECPKGYRSGPDGWNCIDINECETGEASCARSDNPADVCQNTRGGYHCHTIECPEGYRLENKRCTKINRMCPYNDWNCQQQPSSYTYNFITIVSKIYLPTSSVELFTMHGPAWASSVINFELKLVRVNAGSGVKPADLNCFDMRPTHNVCRISLLCSLAGPQVVEMELTMSLYQYGQFAGKTVARLIVIVSQYEF